jgi:hypothetical protein
MRAGACIYCGLSLLSKWQLSMECPEGPWFHPGALDPRTNHMQCCGRLAQSEVCSLTKCYTYVTPLVRWVHSPSGGLGGGGGGGGYGGDNSA